MDNAAGLDFLPEFYVDIETVIDKKRAMISCHKSQEIWMKEAYGEAVSEIMERKSHMRGLAITKKYAEGFRKVRTYPFLNSASLLPGYATPLS
jgi:LmbE family N-acetylglucosaminyl deacetylase